MDQFIQHKGRRKNIFEITPTGVRWTHFINRKDSSIEHFPFEHVKSDRMLFTTTSPLFAVAGGLILFTYAFLLLEIINTEATYDHLFTLWPLGGISSIAFYVFYRPKTYVIRMKVGRPIKFFPTTKPASLFTFIEEIIRKRDTYLRNMYGNPDPRASYDSQYSNLQILLSDHVITVEEYNKKISELNELFAQSQPSVQFFQYSQN